MKTCNIFLVLFLLLSCYSAFGQSTGNRTGLASFYHDYFNGKRTASGEILNQKKFTCAHRTLPYGTRLKVTNLENGKTAVVTVNDRGPFVKGRIIDVTAAVAKHLGFFALGQAKVEIEIVSSEERSDSIYYTSDSLSLFYKIETLNKGIAGYSVKVASYYVEAKAFETVRELEHKVGGEIFVQQVQRPQGLLYRVFAGKYETRTHAEKEQEKISEHFPDCYVVELKDK